MQRRVPKTAARADAAAPRDAEIITAAEVAVLLRMTPAWVYSETRQNRIPHMRLGRYFRYRRSVIETWMATIEEGPYPESRTTIARPVLLPMREPSQPRRITDR
jgi:excisionase family DNA binding protein